MLDIDKVVNRLQHYKHLGKLLEAHETRSASIALRKIGMKDKDRVIT